MEILTITRDRECVSLNCHRHKYAQILPAAFHTFDLSVRDRTRHYVRAPLPPPPSLPLRGGDPWQAFSPGAPRFQLNKKSGRIRAGKRYVQSNVLELINGDKEGRAD